MARVVREVGRALWWVLPLMAVAVFLLLPPTPARGGTYTDSFWTSSSSNPECICDSCGCEAPPIWSPEGVNYLTGELMVGFDLYSTPGYTGTLQGSLIWRSMVQGASQLGEGVIPSWLCSAEYVVLIGGNPTGANGHKVLIRDNGGRIATYMWGGPPTRRRTAASRARSRRARATTC